jgi:hypothetical protein
MKNDNKNGLSSTVVLATGAVVGAGVALAGATVLKDEKNRKRMKNLFTDVKEQALDHLTNAQEDVEEGVKKVGKKLANGNK